MMHLAYPNVKQAQFQACVRYLSLPRAQAPQPVVRNNRIAASQATQLVTDGVSLLQTTNAHRTLQTNRTHF